jgi:hypothetical protein
VCKKVTPFCSKKTDESASMVTGSNIRKYERA